VDGSRRIFFCSERFVIILQIPITIFCVLTLYRPVQMPGRGIISVISPSITVPNVQASLDKAS